MFRLFRLTHPELVPNNSDVQSGGKMHAPRRRGRPRLTPEQRKARGSLVARVARPSIDPNRPLHVTIRAKKGVPGFRSKRRFLRMRESLRAAADRFGMRVVHFA